MNKKKDDFDLFAYSIAESYNNCKKFLKEEFGKEGRKKLQKKAKGQKAGADAWWQFVSSLFLLSASAMAAVRLILQPVMTYSLLEDCRSVYIQHRKKKKRFRIL